MNINRLQQAGSVLDRLTSEGAVVGGSMMILKDCKEIYRHHVGYADREREYKACDDAIYRIYSMSKPITAAAIMILYDRGLFDLDDELAQYLPAFKNMRVVNESGEYAAESPILIRHVLDMTSGICYPDGMTRAEQAMTVALKEIYARADAGEHIGTIDFVNRIAQEPLCFQPGRGWNYGFNADIAGALCEVLSKMSYRDFLMKEIFEPLHMKDTDFYVPIEKQDRMSQFYMWDEASQSLTIPDWMHLGLRGFFKTAPDFESGGAGLVSTLDDYKNFAIMMMNRGVFEGRRILSEKAIDYITSNHLNDEQKRFYNWEQCKGYGYGCLNRVLIDEDAAGAGNVGEFGWDGWLGTNYANDPKDGITIILMIQRVGGFGATPLVEIKKIIYDAIQ